MADFQASIGGLLQREGGSRFTNDPSDAGGATRYGITLKVYQEHGADLDGDGDIDVADLRILDELHAEDFYEQEYWQALQLDQILAQGIGDKLFDMGVNLGTGCSCKFLQMAVGAPVDGQMGPITLAAANKMEPKILMAKLVAAQTDYYWAITARNVAKKAPLPLPKGLGWKLSWIPVAQDAISSRNLGAIALLLASIKATPGTLPGNIRFIKGWLTRAALGFGL